jgi:hypothetical protein
MAGLSPFDARCMLALVALPLAWKLLSLDFTGLGDLCDRPPIFSFHPQWLKDLLVENRCLLFQGSRTRYIQSASAALLVLSVLSPSRFFLVPAIILAWLLDTGAALFRFNFFTLDTPIALLVLIAICPVRLSSAARLSLVPSADARVLFTACFTYVATYYVLAGLAKLVFDWRWPFVVKIGNYYPISFLWHGQTMPEPIDTIARVASQAMIESPWLDTMSAFVVLVEQFLWILAPFSVILRAHAGLFSAGYHVVVALTTGIMFVTWIPIALAVSIPFSAIARFFTKTTDENLVEASGGRRYLAGAVAALAFAAACLPSRGTVVPPFYNYLAFGWRYPYFEEMKPFYRIGFRHPAEGTIKSLPLHHAGFLDFMHVGYLDVSARYVVESEPASAVKTHFSEAIRSLMSVMRSRHANGWLLGSWRSPVHLISDPGDLEIHKMHEFLILQGTPLQSQNGHPASARWRICGYIDLSQTATESVVRTLPQCVDEQ